MTKAKPEVETLAEAQPASGPVPVAQEFPGNASEQFITFRDTLYSSRTVILPDGRTLPVAKSIVAVEMSDDVALKCLKAHPEYEQLKE
ncbi:hypothetical protein M5G22_00585 [Pseudomonas sp. TNT2022 ID233]|uniref:hypothetical protein n=1 Tax=Pseudomonas aphyarum TaxID=2942629 RepID=UPI00236070E7|nr:hypothetical protein [Pseudomonas aphyarum]MDD1136038.1 hypothetical protein [Pseudomonas aphyarum]